MSSFIPVLSDVLYYSPTDSYDYLTDNRPIYNIDTNTRAIASSLVGIGYGEHLSVNGGLLTPGKAVELLSNSQIKYPDGSTSATTGILGIVIGSSSPGLNKVIWGSSLLDLATVGLSSIVTGSSPGLFLKVAANSTGTISLVSSTSSTDLIVGKIKSGTIVTIGKELTGVLNTDVAPITNSHNLYGFTRLRNILLALDGPVQYEKTTVYQSDISISSINIMNAQLPATNPVISAGPSVSVSYGADSYQWKVKEKYAQLLVGATDVISDSPTAPPLSWAGVSYQSTFTGGVENFERAQIGAGIDYSTSGNLSLFKEFSVSKYYQYAKVASGDPIYGKVTVTATVFDPQGTGLGGESSTIIIWDFYDYNSTTGLEIKKRRAITMGSSADTIYSNTSIFPSLLRSA